MMSFPLLLGILIKSIRLDALEDKHLAVIVKLALRFDKTFTYCTFAVQLFSTPFKISKSSSIEMISSAEI